MPDRTCLIDGCTKLVMARGWCSAHYSQWRRAGDPLGSTRKPHPTCSVEGCPKLVHSHGMCSAHESRHRRHGDPLGGGTTPGEGAAFIRAAAESQSVDCIVWPFGTMSAGYGQLSVDGRRLLAHRFALELTQGPAPDPSMEAAHAPGICHNRLCVNPRHLRWAERLGNVADKTIDGTYGIKLTEAQVVAIRIDQRTHSTIAAEYGVTRSNVGKIKAGTTWAWLD